MPIAGVVQRSKGDIGPYQRIQIATVDGLPAALSPTNVAVDWRDRDCEISMAGNVSWKQTPGGVRRTSTAPRS